MKKYFYYLFLLIFLGNCGKSSIDIPKDILSRQKMRSVLIDIHLLEGKIAESGYIYPDTATINYVRGSKIIWKKHKIDSVYFRKSFQYYTQNPAILTQIYQEVVDSLSLREVKVKTKQKINN
ncbi:MAG: DUF4296 domain-containing protein [Cytophagales bacterium]|nr:MAG: DUF4296 domain-containing protein [Cytophagales bacterium]